MIAIHDKLISRDLFEEEFACNLSACKGICCVEGDAGAPVRPEEVERIQEGLDEVLPGLSDEGRRTIEEVGAVERDDEDGVFRTPLLEDGACAYAIREKGIVLCGMETAWRDGRTAFMKPVSCHLYPVRISRYEGFEAVNYERWDICSPACTNGRRLGIPVFRFVSDALERAYGADFVEAMEQAYDHLRGPSGADGSVGGE